MRHRIPRERPLRLRTSHNLSRRWRMDGVVRLGGGRVGPSEPRFVIAEAEARVSRAAAATDSPFCETDGLLPEPLGRSVPGPSH